jgi:hypothetical protein
VKSSNDLPLVWVERIFQRLHGRFGNPFLDKFRTGQADVNGNDIGIENAKRIWSEELAGISAERLKTALEASYDYPPSCDEFKQACRSRPESHVDLPKLPKPEIEPEQLEKRRSEVRTVAEAMKAKHPSREWAQRILSRREAGEKLPNIAVEFAQEAIGG